MSINEEFKNRIVNLYNEINKSNKDKIDLLKKAVDLEDPFFIDFRKEIRNSIKKNNGEEVEEENYDDIAVEDIPEILVDKYSEDEEVSKDLLRIIKINVLDLLKKINMELNKKNIESLKYFVINDTFETCIQEEISDVIRNKIIDFISNLIKYHFKEYQSKKEYKRKEMLIKVLNEILPDVNNFFDNNSHKKLNKMTLYQRKYLINYFLTEIYSNYLQDDLDNKIINKEEYDFLREKIKMFVLNKYEKILYDK